jgi:hypothetical protein
LVLVVLLGVDTAWVGIALVLGKIERMGRMGKIV